MELQHLDYKTILKTGIIGVSGKVYRLESELSAERYFKLQEFMIEATSGNSASEWSQGVSRAYQLLQGATTLGAIMQAADELRRVIHGTNTMSNIPHPAQKAVALFFNSTDDTLEDRQVFDESKMIAKIEDWRGYGLQGFFPLLTSIAPGSKVSSSANSGGRKTRDKK